MEPQAANDTRKAEASQPPPRVVNRGPLRRRFKGFDDDDDDTVLPDPTQTFPNDSNNENLSCVARSQQNSVSLPQAVPERGLAHARKLSQLNSNPQMGIDAQEAEDNDTPIPNDRKRPAPDSDEENEEDFIDSLVPAATAIKRRRLVEEEEAKRTGKKSTAASFLQSQLKIETPKPKKVKKEINVKDAVRERREAEEEAARQNEEDLRATLEGMSVEEMKKLAVVEEMVVPGRSSRLQRREADGVNERWDPAWNGRRNFKKFRRKGENSNVRRGRSVMVPLEEVKKKDFGIGEDYWDEPDGKKKRRKEKERATQSQSQTISSGSHHHTAEVPAELMANCEDREVVDIDAPRTTRHTNHTPEVEGSDTGFKAVNGKRRAPDRAKAPAAKKQKLLLPESESDSDDDELKFRFKRKR